MFSHMHLWHVGLNMVALMSFVPRCIDGPSSKRAPKLSPGEFWAMYLTSGVASSIASNLFSRFIDSGARCVNNYVRA